MSDTDRRQTTGNNALGTGLGQPIMIRSLTSYLNILLIYIQWRQLLCSKDTLQTSNITMATVTVQQRQL